MHSRHNTRGEESQARPGSTEDSSEPAVRCPGRRASLLHSRKADRVTEIDEGLRACARLARRVRVSLLLEQCPELQAEVHVPSDAAALDVHLGDHDEYLIESNLPHGFRVDHDILLRQGG